jgi:hypothetical protein
MKELFAWIEAAVKKCIEDLENGIYNSNVKTNLAASSRSFRTLTPHS